MRGFLAASVFCLLAAAPAAATDNGQWAGQPAAERAWYSNATLTPAAQKRLGWAMCCDHSDVVHTKFRVNKTTGADEWWWLDGDTWKLVPADVIHWGESAPGGQPTLFVFEGEPTCFYPGDGGN
jgi:hypothetical protein